MTEISNTTRRSRTPAPNSEKAPLFSTLIPLVFWGLLAVTLALSGLYLTAPNTWHLEGYLRVNGFTLLMWTTVSLFSALISTYGKRYLSGFRFEGQFMLLTLAFTLSVMLLMAAEHIAILVISWTGMGYFMSKLIGINRDWGEARNSGRMAALHFMAGSLCLTAGLGIPAVSLETYQLSHLLEGLSGLPTLYLFISALLLITAGMIQSAIYPFHRWLLSSMTAPTPSSALMHAGFVNGAGLLLTLTAPLIVLSKTSTLLFIIGGLCAVVAQFAKLLQISVKQRLACSTIAQMGFMIMQCGLGFYNAAVAHLILHGFYKAYLFLSSGEGVQQTHPKQPPQIRISPAQTLFVLVNGLAGAWLFARLTGKGLQMDSGIFLTLIVAIAVGQVTYNFIKQYTLPTLYRITVPILMYMAGIVLYALAYNGVGAFMADSPMTLAPQQLTPVQVFFGILFLIGFFMMKLGVYRKYPRFYVLLLNTTQPFRQTVLKFKKQ